MIKNKEKKLKVTNIRPTFFSYHCCIDFENKIYAPITRILFSKIQPWSMWNDNIQYWPNEKWPCLPMIYFLAMKISKKIPTYKNNDLFFFVFSKIIIISVQYKLQTFTMKMIRRYCAFDRHTCIGSHIATFGGSIPRKKSIPDHQYV